MQQQLKKIPAWMCELERYFYQHPDWDLIHDGQKNPGQFKFPPKDIRCFTRRYKCTTEEAHRFIGAWGAMFRYDLRNGIVADVKFEFNREGNGHKKAKDVFERRHE